MRPPRARWRSDLEEVYTRAFYHPAGSGEDAQVLIEAERIYVWTKGEFRRPTGLGPREALALGLGLRILAQDEGDARRAEIMALAEQLDSMLTSAPARELLRHFEIGEGAAVRAGGRPLLLEAAREWRRCEVLYLQTGADRPDKREIEPYVLVSASGSRSSAQRGLPPPSFSWPRGRPVPGGGGKRGWKMAHCVSVNLRSFIHRSKSSSTPFETGSKHPVSAFLSGFLKVHHHPQATQW